MGCRQCGVCCKLFLINLSEEEYRSGRFKTMFDEFVEDFEEAQECGINVLAKKEDGTCIYLTGGRCSVYSTRPQSCRKFFCDSKEERFKSMIDKIDGYKRKDGNQIQDKMRKV